MKYLGASCCWSDHCRVSREVTELGFCSSSEKDCASMMKLMRIGSFCVGLKETCCGLSVIRRKEMHLSELHVRAGSCTNEMH